VCIRFIRVCLGCIKVFLKHVKVYVKFVIVIESEITYGRGENFDKRK